MQRDTNDKPIKKKANSLEYYNDDMPRKAVGKLFSAFDDDEEKSVEVEPEEEEEEIEEDKDIVSGYDDSRKDIDYYEPTEPRRRLRSSTDSRDLEARSGRSRGYTSDRESRDRELRDRDPRDREPRDRELRDRELRDRELRDRELLDREPRDRESRRDLYEFIEEPDPRNGKARSGSNYDFGMYRKKDKKTAATRATAKRKPLYDDDYDDDKPAKKFFATAPIPIQNPRPKSKAADTSEPIMKKSQSARFFDNDYADDDDDAPLLLTSPGTLKIIAASVCVLFLIILTMLIVKLNIVSAKVKTYEEQLTDYNTTKESFSALQMQYDTAQRKISDLEDQLSSVDNQSGSTPPASGINIDSPDNTLPPSSLLEGGNASSATPAPAVSGKKYTVRSGDTLMKIAREQMGDSSKYQAIIDANGLSSTELQVGQEIIIPQS